MLLQRGESSGGPDQTHCFGDESGEQWPRIQVSPQRAGQVIEGKELVLDLHQLGGERSQLLLLVVAYTCIRPGDPTA